ncbi:MAG: ankyrin repeat domain-containing protein [Synergistaceae bacterium]|nr:ankyrin repeat domain-containing protein [Synergistaceae bacterium]
MRRIVLALLLVFMTGCAGGAENPHPEAPKDTNTAALLEIASKSDTTPKQIKLLIKEGAHVNASDETGNTALMSAAGFNSNVEVIRALLNAGADINASDKNGWTALMKAAWYNNNIEVIKILLDSEADINLRDVYGKTAKDYAAENKNLDIRNKAAILEWLVDWDNALLNAAQQNERPTVIKRLIKAKANVNAKNRNSITPLMMAAANSDYPEVIEALVKAGADVNAQSDAGQTALVYAVRFNPNPKILRALIRAGADVSVSDGFFWGKTAYDIAVKNNATPEIIKILEGL